MDYTKKIMYQSNSWYNDGLRKAQVRDMSGAIVSLQQSLQYNRENIAARNLLGLVYYGIGEVSEALVEWIISKNLCPRDNIADYYIKNVQNSANELESLNQAIKKFNQCLVYCQQNGEDLAIIQLKQVIASHPTFLKAYQLLALIYIQMNQNTKARQILIEAKKLDTTNELTLTYLQEVTKQRGRYGKNAERSFRKPKSATVEYSLGNETIIQPAHGKRVRQISGKVTAGNIFAGVLIGAAIVWFLIVPSVDEAKVAKQNKQVVEYAMAIGLATNCKITQVCKFDRKNYFYPDNPQNYQISQLYLPIARDGYVEIESGSGKKKVRIHEMHMEEDAGKLVHDEWDDTSLVDYNRSGVPLVEIVSEPDMRSAEEVIAYLEKLRMIVQYLGASDCKLQEGSMRADVNLSVREVGSDTFGTRTEMKNLNSFKAIAHAIEGERQRQIELLEEGKAVTQETRRWDDNKEHSYAMRSKEDAQDYRYFPEPDLVPIVISDDWIEKIRAQQPELRTEKLERYKKEFDIPEYDAEIITESKHMADLFEATTAICNKPKKVSNWLMVETMRLMKEHSMEAEDLKFSPVNLAKLIELNDAGTVNSSVAKEVFEQIFLNDIEPDVYVEEHGLKTVNDADALRTTLEKVIADNPQAVADYRGGKEKALGALVGQTMKAMKGKANPGMVNKMLREMLG